mgnify:CR=1 FL=1
MSRPLGATDKQPRKAGGGRYPATPDSQAYRLPDSGCKEATLELGKQSSCLECPFFPSECILKIKDDKNNAK